MQYLTQFHLQYVSCQDTIGCDNIPKKNDEITLSYSEPAEIVKFCTFKLFLVKSDIQKREKLPENLIKSILVQNIIF